MTQPNAESGQNIFNISNSSIGNVVGSGSIHYNEAPDQAVTDQAVVSEASVEPKKVLLFLAANPTDTYKLRLDEEVREIEAGLRRSQYRDRFELRQQWAVRPIDLRRAMLDCKPQIVHFSGHGIGQATRGQSTEATREISLADDVAAFDEGLVLEDATGQAKLVSTEALSALFELFADSVECVVLNACYSQRQASAIAQHVPYVIGMNQAIGDRAAIEFAIGFYDALGAGKSIKHSYKTGCVAVQLAGIPEHLTPVMVSD
jgi:CHAT domain